MSTPKKLDIGVIVVCIRSLAPEYSYIVGHVGTITDKLDDFTAFLSGDDWVVDFPTLKNVPCPGCGRMHGSRYPMASAELKPIEDPDQQQSEDRDEDAPIEHTECTEHTH